MASDMLVTPDSISADGASHLRAATTAGANLNLARGPMGLGAAKSRANPTRQKGTVGALETALIAWMQSCGRRHAHRQTGDPLALHNDF